MVFTLYGFGYIIGFEQVNPMPVPPPNIAASMRSKCTHRTQKNTFVKSLVGRLACKSLHINMT